MMTPQIAAPLNIEGLDNAGSFTGYAAVFGSVDSQNDLLKPGAFSRSLAAHREADTMPALLWMHDASKPIGVWQSVQEDEKGLKVSGKLTLGVGQADEAYTLLKEKAVTGLSIGYRVRESHHDPETGARVLTDVDLKEISLVAMPAHTKARVEQVKALSHTAKSSYRSDISVHAVKGFIEARHKALEDIIR